jgi:hypothetical protein
MLKKLELSAEFSKNTKQSNFMKVRSIVSRDVPCGQTDRHDETNRPFSQNFAKRASKACPSGILSTTDTHMDSHWSEPGLRSDWCPTHVRLIEFLSLVSNNCCYAIPISNKPLHHFLNLFLSLLRLLLPSPHTCFWTSAPRLGLCLISFHHLTSNCISV